MAIKRKDPMEELFEQIRSGNIDTGKIDFSNESKNNISDDTMEQVFEQIRSGNIDTSKIDFGDNTKEDEEIDSSNWFKKSKAFTDDEGNILSDTAQTILGTVGDIGKGITKGIMHIGEGIGDTISNARAQILENQGNVEEANKIRERIKEDTISDLFEGNLRVDENDNSIIDDIFNNASEGLGNISKAAEDNSILGDKSDSIVEGLGYVAGITAIGIATGGTGFAATAATTATTFTSAMGQGLEQAYQEGANSDDAWKFGVISGLAEAGSELLFGGLGKASGTLGLSKGLTSVDDALAKKVSGVFKSTLGKNLSEYVIKAGAEGTEEVISGFIQAIGQKLTYKSEEDLGKLVKDQNLLEQFVSGAITSAIAQVPGQNGIYKTTKSGRDFITNLTQNEAKVYDKELTTRVDEKTRNAAIEKAYKEQLAVQEKLGVELTEEKKNTIRQAVEDAYNSGRIKSDEKISSKEYEELEKNVRKDLEEGNVSLDRIRETIGENQDISKDDLLKRSYYEEEQKNVRYQVQQTDNEKVNKLYQSAADAGMNNNNKTRKKIELIAKLTKDTDRQYKFVSPEQLKEMGYNEKANGLINKETGEILINSHSDKGIQSIIGHETTHIFDSKDEKGNYTKEYEDLQKFAIEYAKEKGIYEDKIKNITEAYGNILGNETQVNEELTADLIGDFLFNDEKFIENLSIRNKNVFQKIYDYIKHSLKLATAGSKEARQLENIKYQFDKVYRTISEETNTDTKYSIGGVEAVDNIKGDTNLYNEAINNYNIAKNMAKNKANNKEILEKTGWYKDKKGKWKFEFSDKDMKIKSLNYKNGTTEELGNILTHDTLFKFYPELKHYTVKFENLKNANGSYNRGKKIIKLDMNKFNTTLEAEKTLIHEIQHAIQEIEGFSRGASSKNGIIPYYNSLGEIEAADTSSRMEQEKKGLELTEMPETSKKHPTHPKLRDMSPVDKARFYIYNTIKDMSIRRNNKNEIFEISQTEVEENNRKNRNMVVERKRLIGDDNNYEVFEKDNQEYQERNNALVDARIKEKGDSNEINYQDMEQNDGEAVPNSNRQVWNRLDNENSNKSSFNLPKIKEGYTRLYRGINEEYNNNYDKSKLDNVNGYESWTDNYDLAKSYGDNVYYIDIPTSEIKNSIIDEDRNSETYGDRNLIYKNDKPVGINGKSGNEYMLYTEHDNHSNIQYNKIENNSSVDNKGRKLTKEQQEYFKESKALNDKGELETVYHGTNKAGFMEFNRNYNYYTNNKEMAQSYTGGTEIVDTKKLESIPDAKSWLKGINENAYIENNTVYDDGEVILQYNSQEDLLKNLKRDIQKEYGNTEAGGVYEGYINITKPVIVDAKGDKWSMIGIDGISINGIDDIKGFLNDYGSSTWKEKGKLRTSTNDIVEAVMNAIEDERIDADGIIIKNVYDEGGYGNTIPTESGTDYITFNSNQFKAVDNMNPTEDPDIRYSNINENKITGDDIAVKDMLMKEKNPVLDEFVGVDKENIDIAEKTTNENSLETNLKTKARNYISRSKTKFKNDVVAKFGTSKIANTSLLNSTVESMQNDIIANGKLNNEQINNYFDVLYDNLKKIDTAYYDEYKDVKTDIRNTKFYVSDKVRGDISDYNLFRQNNMGNLILTNNPDNIGIDTKYKELVEMYPELFPDYITNSSDQLLKIAEVTKDIAKVETNVSAYNDKYMGREYRKWAREEFGTAVSDLTKDIHDAMRYNKEIKAQDKIEISKEEVKAVYQELPMARKKYEKALAKEVLTANDRIQVDRLLNGEIEINELPKDSNQEGIIRLATAKSEYNYLQKAVDSYVKNIKQARIDEAQADVGDLNRWKDKSAGWKYSRETAIRNIYDIAPKEVADKIIDKYFRSYIEVNEKNVIDNINKYNNEISELDLGTKKQYKIEYDGQKHKVSESALVQLFGENKITLNDIKESGADTTKIENAVSKFRSVYNELIEQINDAMLNNGYAPMEYRKDYFPHFTEDKADTLLGKAAKLIGIDISNKDNLPTDISGQTMNFKPGRTWFSNMLQRTGDITDYDALKGFDKYIRGASDLIYHTDDIQKLRALENVIRGTYNDTEIQNKVVEIQESTTLNDFEKAEAIQKIYEQAKDRSHLSNFVTWLQNYTNLMAGKKSINDRGAEKELNRKMYSTMQSIESRFAANAIGGNIGVALTNFAPLAQATGETKISNLAAGIWQTMKASIKGDTSFASESQFITRRRGSNYLYQTTTDKITNLLTSPLEFVDNFTSESIVRAKYLQNIKEGMTEQRALEEADRYTAGLMADRGRGALPTQFNNKSPFAKMINMFQVEVNNQWSYYFKDLPRNVQENGKNNLVAAYSKIMIGSYLLNEVLGSVRGNSTRVLPDPIYIIKEFIKGLSDDDDDNDADTVLSTLSEIVGNIPFVSLPATLLGADDVGRVPLTGLIPDLSNIVGNVTDVANDKKTLGEGAQDISKELLDTLGSSLLLPFGGSQIKKTVKGLDLYSSDKVVPGSYTDKGDLRYTVDDDIGSKAKSAIFGAYANPYAQDYVDSGYKTIKSNNIDELVALDMNSTEYRNYKKGLSKSGDISDKNKYKQYTDNSGNIYWYDSKNEIMYDSNYKKTILSADDLTKVSKIEEQLNYIDSLDVSDDKKNIMANNINKNSKKTIDMKEYSNYDSYEEYKYARDYPEKYSVISQIGTYDEFNEYNKEISRIEKEYKELSEGATSKQKTAISKQKKQEIREYIEGLPLNMYQKMMLEKEAAGYSIKNNKNQIYSYLEEQNLTTLEKYNIWKELFE